MRASNGSPGWRGRCMVSESPMARAAVLALNSDRYFETLYAIAWAGGVFVPVNTRLAAPEIAYWVSDSDARVRLDTGARRTLRFCSVEFTVHAPF